jgi:hypothetical protein
MKNPIASSRKSAGVFGAIVLALTVIGAVLRIINLYTSFEINTGYYYSSALLVDVMHALFVLAVIGFGVLAFVMAKKISLVAIDRQNDPTVRVLLCFLAVAALVYIIAKSYFDVYFPMNSPNKILLHIACLAAMLLFVALARVNLGVLKERSYLFFLASATFLSGVYAIPSVFFCAISKLYREYTYFFFDVIIFAVFVFAAAKLVLLITAKKPEVEAASADEIEAIFEETDTAEAQASVAEDDTGSAPEESAEK